MRSLQWLVGFASILATSCDSRDASHASAASAPPEQKWSSGPPSGWTTLEAPLEHYVEHNPGKPIIVAFGAEWVIATQVNWRSLSIGGVTDTLQSAGFVCISADLTQDNQIARYEMRELHYDTVPLTIIYDPTTRKWDVMPHAFTAENVEEWVASLSQRIAAQTTGKPAARHLSDSEGGGKPQPESEGRSW